MCIHRYKLVHDVWMRWFFLHSFAFCREESLCQYTKCQQTRRDAPKLPKLRLAVLFPSAIFHPWRQSWYFHKSKALHTKGRLGHCCKSLLLRYVIQCCFFSSLIGHDHQLVWCGQNATHLFQKNKNCEDFFLEGLDAFLWICTSKNFSLYSIICRKPAILY